MAPKSAGTPQQSKEKQKDVVIALAPTTPAAATAVDYASPVSVSSTTATWKCPICDEDGACGDLPRVVPWKAGAEPASEGSSSKVSLKDVDMPREMDKICSLVAHLVKAHPEHVVTRNKHRMVAVEDCCSTKIKRPKLDAVSWPYLEHFMFYHHTPTLHHLQCPLCKQGHTTREELRKCVTGAGTPKSKATSTSGTASGTPATSKRGTSAQRGKASADITPPAVMTSASSTPALVPAPATKGSTKEPISKPKPAAPEPSTPSPAVAANFNADLVREYLNKDVLEDPDQFSQHVEPNEAGTPEALSPDSSQPEPTPILAVSPLKDDVALPVLQSPTDEGSPLTLEPPRGRAVGNKYKLPYDEEESRTVRTVVGKKDKDRLRSFDQDFDEDPDKPTLDDPSASRQAAEIDDLSEFLQDTQLSSLVNLDAAADRQLQEVITIFKSL